MNARDLHHPDHIRAREALMEVLEAHIQAIYGSTPVMLEILVDDLVESGVDDLSRWSHTAIRDLLACYEVDVPEESDRDVGFY